MNQVPLARAPARLADARALCEQKLLDTDLSLYYSVLFLPAPQRAAAAALYAFWLEVREINDECAEAEIARLKLAWWREEISETFAGHPRHPIALALAPVIAAHDLPARLFFELLDALAQHADTGGYTTFDSLQAHGAHTRGRAESLAVRLAGPPSASALESAARLGAALEVAALLRDTPADARRGRSYLPHDDLTRFGVTLDDLRAGHAGEPVRALLAFEAGRLLHGLTEDLARVSEPDRAALLPPVIGAEIAQALLRKIHHRPQRLLGAAARVVPLQQLWIAWRAARGGTAA